MALYQIADMDDEGTTAVTCLRCAVYLSAGRRKIFLVNEMQAGGYTGEDIWFISASFNAV